MSTLLDMIRARRRELEAAANSDPWKSASSFIIHAADFPTSTAVDAEIARLRTEAGIAAHRGVVVSLIIAAPERPADEQPLELYAPPHRIRLENEVPGPADWAERTPPLQDVRAERRHAPKSAPRRLIHVRGGWLGS